jgi:hypothetical protein
LFLAPPRDAVRPCAVRPPTLVLVALSPWLWPAVASATVHHVGPTRAYQAPADVLGLLAPGDTVEIDGDHTYPGGLSFTRAGTAASPITIRGVPVNGKRPIIAGGYMTIEAYADHHVFEGLEITGGLGRCFVHHADDVTLRDSVVHDCPKQGILGTDHDSGSMLLERVEVYRCGAADQDHSVYMATDPVRYPQSVFRMQHCYVHDANGGHSVKSRAARNEIFYNWIEGGRYHELELIGSDGSPEDAVREDSDVVGNVLWKRNAFMVVRFGGDRTGQTNGRYRFVHNTVIVQPAGGAVFRLFDGIESLEAHNNVLCTTGGGVVDVYREAEALWVTGVTTIVGQNNWIQSGALHVPAGFSGTLGGTDPGFVDLAGNDLRPRAGSPLLDAGAAAPVGPSGHDFPRPLAMPLDVPARSAQLTEPRPSHGASDVGAYERAGAAPAIDADLGVDRAGDAAAPPDSDLRPAVDDRRSAGTTIVQHGSCTVARAARPTWGVALLVLVAIAASRRVTGRRRDA